MGACCSISSPKRGLLDEIDGSEKDYHKRYLEDTVLGNGEFGTVKLVFDVSRPAANPPLACKILRKGVVFKDNVLMAPIKAHVLKGEVDILRALNGQNYCLKLFAVYESSRSLFLITEYCAGGEMMEYVVATHMDQELHTEDVSRIAFQLLSAVNHCANHRIIHRDIKPDNCMFLEATPKAELRLIDFGSGCMDKATIPNGQQEVSVDQRIQVDDDLVWHTTFAGSAFYSSPEMFQRTYTSKTDVWSVGVTLYVLVAGYPADQLQKAFNIMQTSKDRDLRRLPNLPQGLPESFHELLNSLLTYRHKQRSGADKLLQQEFVQFHKHLKEVDAVNNNICASNDKMEYGDGDILERSATLPSVALTGTQQRHSLFLGFKRFERSLTTLLATMLTKRELQKLLEVIHELIDLKEQSIIEEEEMHVEESLGIDSPNPSVGRTDQKLLVIQVNELKSVLHETFQNPQLSTAVENLPFSAAYGFFAYHVALLSEFAELEAKSATSYKCKRNQSFSYLRSYGEAGVMTHSAGSRGSVQSLFSLSKNKGVETRRHSSSVRGGSAIDM